MLARICTYMHIFARHFLLRADLWNTIAAGGEVGFSKQRQARVKLVQGRAGGECLGGILLEIELGL